MLFELNHNNIVKIYDVCRIEGKLFLKMELIDELSNIGILVQMKQSIRGGSMVMQ